MDSNDKDQASYTGAAKSNDSDSDSLLDLRKFYNSRHPEKTKIGLRLLKMLPTSRDAVMSHLGTVFMDECSRYSARNRGTGGDDAQPSEAYDLTEVYSTLCFLIKHRPTAWVPIVSQFSLEALGEISVKFGHGSKSDLNTILVFWLNCPASKLLVDLTTLCLSQSDTNAACISALLDTSSKYSPHFDWVVAHVGRCFPAIVIERVLLVGMKDFQNLRTMEQAKNSAKLHSVVGILEHLSFTHPREVFESTVELLDKHKNEETAKTVFVFLLQLCLSSNRYLDTVLRPPLASASTFRLAHQHLDDWFRFYGSVDMLQELMLSAVLQCSGHVKLILDLALELEAYAFLQLIVYDLRTHHPFGQSLAAEIDYLTTLFCSTHHKRQALAKELFVKLAKSGLLQIDRLIANLLCANLESRQLTLLTSIAFHGEPGIVSEALRQVLVCGHSAKSTASGTPNEQLPTHFWSNLLWLVENEGDTFQPALRNNAELVAKTRPYTDTIVKIVEFFSDTAIDVEIALKMAPGLIDFYLANGGMDALDCLWSIVQTNAVRVYSQRYILETVLFEPVDDADETELTDKISYLQLFREGINDPFVIESLIEQNMQQNRERRLWSKFLVRDTTAGSSSGASSTGPATQDTSTANPTRDSRVIELMKICCCTTKSTIEFECHLGHVANMSLLLVQYVSPDVMYNGLPWPDEEFACRVTLERDLAIKRMFDERPILWHLLTFVAAYRPALCYCSVLLRALMSAYMQRWGSLAGSATDAILLRDTVRLLDIMSMSQLLPPPLSQIGMVLPHLSSTEVVAILRECVWAYMRDHIPSPALFQKFEERVGSTVGSSSEDGSSGSNSSAASTSDPPTASHSRAEFANAPDAADDDSDQSESRVGPLLYWRDPTQNRPAEQYIHTLRLIMQRNIEKMRHLYRYMFIELPKND